MYNLKIQILLINIQNEDHDVEREGGVYKRHILPLDHLKLS